MKKIYLVLAIVGAIVPYVFFFQFFQAEGLGLAAFVEALFVNGAAGGFSADLLFTSFVFWLFMFTQQKKGQRARPLSVYSPESGHRFELRFTGVSLCQRESLIDSAKQSSWIRSVIGTAINLNLDR